MRYPIPILYLLVLEMLSGVRANNPLPGGVLVSRQGPRPRRRKWHNGIDLSAPRGTPVYPVFDGTVEHICVPGVDCCGYGRAVLTRHTDDLFSFYAHLDRVDVSEGQPVTATTQLGVVGDSFGDIRVLGCPPLPMVSHLHLELQHAGFPLAGDDYAARYDVLQVLAAGGLRVAASGVLESTAPFAYEEAALVAAREKAGVRYEPEIVGPALRYGRWYTIGLPLAVSGGIAALAAGGAYLLRTRR